MAHIENLKFWRGVKAEAEISFYDCMSARGQVHLAVRIASHACHAAAPPPRFLVSLFSRFLPFPPSRMPASIDDSIKLFVCLRVFSDFFVFSVCLPSGFSFSPFIASSRVMHNKRQPWRMTSAVAGPLPCPFGVSLPVTSDCGYSLF